MFNRITDAVRNLIILAQAKADEAESQVGALHVLFALLDDRTRVGVRLLESLGVDPDTLHREILARLLAAADDPDPSATSDLPSVVEFACEESMRQHHNYIGTEHVVLGVLRTERGPAHEILTNLGVSLERAREGVFDILHGAPVEEADDPPKSFHWFMTVLSHLNASPAFRLLSEELWQLEADMEAEGAEGGQSDLKSRKDSVRFERDRLIAKIYRSVVD